METIAWVFYAADRNSFIELYKKYSNSRTEITPSEVDTIAVDSDPIKSDIEYFTWQNKRYGSFLIFSLLTIKQIACNRQETINKLAKAVQIAEENGATLILLAGMLGNFALDVAKLKTKHSTKIHTGRNNLICTIVENFFKSCQRIKKSVAGVNVTIFDNSTKTAVIVSRILSKYGANVFLIDTGDRKSKFQALTACSLISPNCIEDVVKSSDIVINCIMQLPHSALEALSPGTVLLDSVPPYISSILVRKSGKDIITEESVWIRSTRINIKQNDEISNGGLIYSCFGEAVMTVIEKTDEHLHQLSMENVEKFFNLRKKYGIEVS